MPQPPQGCSTSCPSAPKLAVESVPNLTKWQSNSSDFICVSLIFWTDECHIQMFTFLWVRLVQSLYFFSRPGREPLPPCPGKNMLFTFSRPPWLPRNCEKRELSASTRKCWNNRTHWILTTPVFQLQWCNVCPKYNRFTSACLMDKIWQNAMLMQCCVPQLQYQLRLTGFAASRMLWCQKNPKRTALRRYARIHEKKLSLWQMFFCHFQDCIKIHITCGVNAIHTRLQKGQHLSCTACARWEWPFLRDDIHINKYKYINIYLNI